MTAKDKKITDACELFITSLNGLVTDDTVFTTLSDVAEAHNLTLTAEQHGIRGTIIRFQKFPQAKDYRGSLES